MLALIVSFREGAVPVFVFSTGSDNLSTRVGFMI